MLWHNKKYTCNNEYWSSTSYNHLVLSTTFNVTPVFARVAFASMYTILCFIKYLGLDSATPIRLHFSISSFLWTFRLTAMTGVWLCLATSPHITHTSAQSDEFLWSPIKNSLTPKRWACDEHATWVYKYAVKLLWTVMPNSFNSIKLNSVDSKLQSMCLFRSFRKFKTVKNSFKTYKIYIRVWWIRPIHIDSTRARDFHWNSNLILAQ